MARTCPLWHESAIPSNFRETHDKPNNIYEMLINGRD
jgi:hypothetical protein